MRAAACLVLLGCSAYEPEPLDGRALLEELRSLRIDLPEDGLDPGGAVAIALVHNPGLRAIRREREIAESLVLTEGAWKNPELRPSLQNLYSGLMNPVAFAFDLRFFPGVPGEGAAAIARAEARERRALAEIEDREARLAAEVRVAHAKVLMLERQGAILEAAARLHERVAGLVDRRLIGFAATRLDETLALLRREEIEDERRSLASERQAALADLGGLLGSVPDAPLRVRPGAASGPAPELVQDKLEDEALRERPDLRALREQYEEREQSLRLAHLARVPWPRFLEPGAGNLPSNPNAGLGMAFEIPIFDSGGSEIALADAQRRQARDAFVGRLHAVRVEIRQAAIRLREAERRGAWLEGRLEPALRRAEEVVRAVLEAGEADALKLVAIETRILDARREVARSEFEVERARIQLDLARGAALKGR